MDREEKSMTSLFNHFKSGAKLGQHLLTSKDIARHVAEAANVAPGEWVIEVGPGKGMLTRELLHMGARVIAIEKDPEMTAILKTTFSKEIDSENLTLHLEDARDFLKNSPTTKPYKVVANIPYYITGELVRLFLTQAHQPTTISLLVQKEVAERIAKTTKESLLSLSVKAYGTPRYIRTVKAGSFNPPPKVDSAILSISNISRENFKNISEEFFFNILHAGFGQKRKTLKGNLRRTFKYSEELLGSVWEELRLDKNIRAEDVHLNEWLAITQLLESRLA